MPSSRPPTGVTTLARVDASAPEPADPMWIPLPFFFCDRVCLDPDPYVTYMFNYFRGDYEGLRGVKSLRRPAKL